MMVFEKIDFMRMTLTPFVVYVFLALCGSIGCYSDPNVV